MARSCGGFAMEDRSPDETLLNLRGEVPKPVPQDYVHVAPNAGKLPDSNPKSQYGVKKVSTLSCIPATAIVAEGKVMMLGRIKYGPMNWRDHSVSAEVYIDAAQRHMMLWNAGEDKDEESGESHLAHVRACMGILIDAQEGGNLIDDRPKDDATIRMIKDMEIFRAKMVEVERSISNAA